MIGRLRKGLIRMFGGYSTISEPVSEENYIMGRVFEEPPISSEQIRCRCVIPISYIRAGERYLLQKQEERKRRELEERKGLEKV